MSIKNYAIQELKRLDKDSVVLQFKEEIINLCEAFGNSGQSGGSAPYVAHAITDTLKKLLSFKSINPILDIEEEWVDAFTNGCLQNSRCGSLFKERKNDRAYYLDAIIWQGEEDWDTFTGRVYLEDELISSRQYVKFPFTPKSFYVNVLRVPISKEEAENKKKMHYIEDEFGKCYYSIVKDPKQLKEVFNYYEK